MNYRIMSIFLFFLSLFVLTSCDIDDIFDAIDISEHDEQTVAQELDHTEVTLIEDLTDTQYFRKNALSHILEGELNRRGEAVGFHYERLPTKKGEVIKGTETEPNEFGVYEAEIKVNGVQKTSNRGKSTFFPKEWDTQQVVDAVNEAYDTRDFVTGNTYEGLTKEGIVIQMYLDDNDKIISAFPVY